MKKQLLCALAASAIASSAFAGNSYGSTTSEASALIGLSVVAVPLVVLTLPVMMVTDVSRAHSDKNRVRVTVNTEKGKETITLPTSVVEKAKLKSGDNLTVTKTRSGAVLSKNEVPLAYMVPPESANLSRSNELAK